jgi:predicted dehydrogenase
MPDNELAGYPVETDLHRALERYHPDAVIVSNPTALHLEVAIPAAEAGCSILLEKPISHTLELVDVLQRAVVRTRVRILMGFQLRFHPCLARAHELIQAGRLGRILSARVQFSEYLPAWHPWEDYRLGYAARADLGGGVLLTQCHSLDYLPWLVGKVSSVWGSLAKLSDLELEVEDTAEISLRFEDGSLGSLHIDYAQQPPSHRIEIGGTLGRLECDLQAGTMRFYDVAVKDWQEHRVPDSWERNAMFMEEMRHFLDVVSGKAEPACTLEDGVEVMRLIAAVQASNSSGRAITVAA